jgi:hypothetical protein
MVGRCQQHEQEHTQQRDQQHPDSDVACITGHRHNADNTGSGRQVLKVCDTPSNGRVMPAVFGSAERPVTPAVFLPQSLKAGHAVRFFTAIARRPANPGRYYREHGADRRFRAVLPVG